MQWMIAGLTEYDSQNDFLGRVSFRFLPIPYCLCWFSHLYQEEQENAIIQIPETVAIVLLLKPP